MAAMDLTLLREWAAGATIDQLAQDRGEPPEVVYQLLQLQSAELNRRIIAAGETT